MAFALPSAVEAAQQRQPSEPLPPLHFASLNCNAAAVGSLLAQGHSPGTPAPRSGLSVLHYAVNNPDATVLRTLLSAGAPVDGAFDRSRGQLTPLLLAAWLGNYVAVADLIDAGANLQRVDSNKKGALILAASNGHSAVINKLLSAGAAVDEEDSCGGTAVEWAALEGELDAVRTLATHGADLAHQDHNGRTALILAALQGHERIVAELLRWNGAMLASITDMDGRTALHWAAVQGHQGVVHQLVEVPGSIATLTQRDAAGRTPMMLAAQYGRPATVCTLLQAVAAAAGEKAAQEAAVAAAGLAKAAGFLRLASTLDPSLPLSISSAGSPQQLSSADNGGELSWMADLQSEWSPPGSKDSGDIGHRTPRLAYSGDVAPPFSLKSMFSNTTSNPLQPSFAKDAVRLSQSFLKPLPASLQSSPVRRSINSSSSVSMEPKQPSMVPRNCNTNMQKPDHSIEKADLLDHSYSQPPVQEVRVDARCARESQRPSSVEPKTGDQSGPMSDDCDFEYRQQSLEAMPQRMVEHRVSALPRPGFSCASNTACRPQAAPPVSDKGAKSRSIPASRLPISANPIRLTGTCKREQQSTTRLAMPGKRRPAAVSVPASPAHPSESPTECGKGSCAGAGRPSVLNSPVSRGVSRIPRPGSRPPSTTITPASSIASSPVCPRTTPFKPASSPGTPEARLGRASQPNHSKSRQVSVSASPVAAHARKTAGAKAAAHLNRLDSVSKARNLNTRGKPQSKSLAILPSERSCFEGNAQLASSRSQLTCAAGDGLVSEVDALLSAGVALEARDSQGSTALQCACRGGHLQVARRLLDAGAKVNAVDEKGRHALLEAATQGNPKLITLLLQSRNGGRVLAQRVDAVGRSALYEAAAHGHVGAVKALLEAVGESSCVDAANSDGRTPLMAAADGGHTAVVSVLASHGADISRTDARGWSAFCEAAHAGHRDTAMALIKRWKSVSGKNEGSDGPEDVAEGAASLRRLLSSALLAAASGGRPTAVDVLLENGADDTFVDESGRNALFLAVVGGHAKFVSAVASRAIRSRHSSSWKSGQGSPLISIIRDSSGRTALHVAADTASETSSAMRRALLSATPNSLLEARDNAGRTPLVAAAEAGDCALISGLIAAGAEIGDGLSVVLPAAQNGRVQALDLLLSKLPAHNESVAGQFALTAASAAGCVASVRALLRLSGSRALSVHRADGEGRLPVVEAARAGHIGVLNLLLERAVRPEDSDASGDSAFTAACREGHIKVLDLLYQRIPRRAQRKALLDQPPRGGQPPLLCAASIGLEQVVRWLLARGAGLDCTDSDGRTATVWAASGRHWETLKVLLDAGADPHIADHYGATATGLVMEADQEGDNGAFEVMELLADRSPPMDDTCLVAVPPATRRRPPSYARILKTVASMPLVPVILPLRLARSVLLKPRVALGAVVALHVAHAVRPELLPIAHDELRRRLPRFSLRHAMRFLRWPANWR